MGYKLPCQNAQVPTQKIIVINDSKKVTAYWKNHPYATRSVHMKACLRTPYDKEHDND